MKLESDLPQKFMHACQTGDAHKIHYYYMSNELFNWTNIQHTQSGNSPLHVAAREGHTNVAKYLCEQMRLSIPDSTQFFEITNNDTKTPLHEAAQYSRPEMVNYLASKGANVNAVKRGDWTPLMLACTKTGPEADLCIRRLLEWGANASFLNKDGWSVIHIICRTGEKHAFSYVLRYAPNSILTRSKNGRSTMHVAAFHGHVELVEVLARKDKDLLNDVDSTGSSPMHEAMKQGNLNMMKKLIELGARVDAVDMSGQTILHTAAQVGNVEAINYILSNRLINPYAKNKYLQTPYQIVDHNNDYAALACFFNNDVYESENPGSNYVI